MTAEFYVINSLNLPKSSSVLKEKFSGFRTVIPRITSSFRVITTICPISFWQLHLSFEVSTNNNNH